MQTTEVETLLRVVISLHQRLNELIGPNCGIHLQFWQQVLTWSFSPRQPFRLIDRGLSAVSNIVWWRWSLQLLSVCFHPLQLGQLLLFASSPFFCSCYKVHRGLGWGYPMPLGLRRSRSEPVCCLTLCRVVSFLSHSPSCAPVLFVLVVFLCFQTKEKHVWHHVVVISLSLAPKTFCFSLWLSCTVVKSCTISQITSSEITIVLLVLVDADSSKLLLGYWGVNHFDLRALSFLNNG